MFFVFNLLNIDMQENVDTEKKRTFIINRIKHGHRTDYYDFTRYCQSM